VHEGGERALFAVLSGKIEVVKLVDGVERRLGWRAPGTIFGEIPIAFGTPFQGGYRATEPSRVIRVEPRHYYAIAAASPEISLKVGALARERIGGLQGIAAEAPKARVTMLGHRWDSVCGDLRRFLARNQITFDSLTPESAELQKLWPEGVPPDAHLPVLRFDDGTVVSRPTLRDVAQRLALQTRARLPEYDTMIIGGGPAGLAAAVYGASEGLRTVVVEREAPGGRPALPRGSRTTWGSPAAFPATSSRAARSSRRDASGQRSW
jgi:thioredoxin reductase (NADPH)